MGKGNMSVNKLGWEGPDGEDNLTKRKKSTPTCDKRAFAGCGRTKSDTAHPGNRREKMCESEEVSDGHGRSLIRAGGSAEELTKGKHWERGEPQANLFNEKVEASRALNPPKETGAPNALISLYQKGGKRTSSKKKRPDQTQKGRKLNQDRFFRQGLFESETYRQGSHGQST